ncbi:hypothetical protein [Phenylobacterium zucineum]|uniref:hypothetical protein n=1 Tax=Phenylobacterium zucineum TaxID=284016 RepID=UPI0011D0CF5D|nr:hypothetical protein [Phenylobacterium zucineum]
MAAQSRSPEGYRFRRSRSLAALACFVPATALATIDFVSGTGWFWQLVQLGLFGAGALIFWREHKRARAAGAAPAQASPNEPPSQ